MPIAILDYGSQYSQLIARRVRELSVYSELFPWDAAAEKVLALKPDGIILSGGPASVYDQGAPHLLPYILKSKHTDPRRLLWNAAARPLVGR